MNLDDQSLLVIGGSIIGALIVATILLDILSRASNRRWARDLNKLDAGRPGDKI